MGRWLDERSRWLITTDSSLFYPLRLVKGHAVRRLLFREGSACQIRTDTEEHYTELTLDCGLNYKHICCIQTLWLKEVSDVDMLAFFKYITEVVLKCLTIRMLCSCAWSVNYGSALFNEEKLKDALQKMTHKTCTKRVESATRKKTAVKTNENRQNIN